MATAPIPIGPAPVVPDASKAESDFDADYEAFMEWQKAVLTPGMNALATNVHGNALAAAEDAATAQAAVGQAGLHATAAGTAAVAAADYASAAAASAAEAAALMQLYLGPLDADPATGRGGVPLVAGNWYQRIGGFIRSYNGTAWVQGLSAVAGVTRINGLDGDLTIPIITSVQYDSRATLRASDGVGYALVDGLGLFAWVAGSDEPDDDESCFATANGRWLLAAAHWDLIDAWQTPDRDAAETAIMHGSASNTITSIASLGTASFTGSVVGAELGAKVVVTPPTQIDARVFFYALVTAQDTITVYLANPSASTATLSAGTWGLAVFNPT